MANQNVGAKSGQVLWYLGYIAIGITTFILILSVIWRISGSVTNHEITTIPTSQSEGARPAFEQKVLLPGQETPIDTPSGYRTTFNLREQGSCAGIRTTQGSIRYCEDGKKYRRPNGSVMYFRPEGTEPLTLVFTREKL